MLALFTIFEHLSNVRLLLNRFYGFYISPTHPTTQSDEEISSNSISTVTEQQRDILLGPILNNILSDNRLNYFDDEFHDDLEQQGYFARELDACLLEMREIERDIYNFKQRQCYFYERYLDFIDKKDKLIEKFIEYHDEYLLNQQDQSISPTTKQLRRQSTKYEFNIPVSNRFELLQRQHTQKFE
jgi:hypothetical protein